MHGRLESAGGRIIEFCASAIGRKQTTAVAITDHEDDLPRRKRSLGVQPERAPPRCAVLLALPANDGEDGAPPKGEKHEVPGLVGGPRVLDCVVQRTYYVVGPAVC